MTDYAYGINFLKQWFASGYRGPLTISGVLASFDQGKIESLGRLARINSTSKWNDVFKLANKEYSGSQIPSKAAFNSYFLQVGGKIDAVKIAGEVALDTVNFVGNLSKYGLMIAAIAAIGAVLIFANNSGKLLSARKA